MLKQSLFFLPLIKLTVAQSDSPPAILPTDDCPVLGPSFPSDFDLTQSKYIKEAISAFPAQVEELLQAGEISNTSSIYIDVFSAVTNKTIYSYSYASENLKPSLTAGKLDDCTIFRIGSVSKLFTVYALLNVAGLDIFQHPVTEYLPELKGNQDITKIAWEEVTVGALASQQGGTGGFPLDFMKCLLDGKCGAEEFLQVMRDVERPVTPVFLTALYSDAGFGVLGLVLERLTNQTFTEALQTHLAKPLELPSSGTTEPKYEGVNALAILGGASDSNWGKDYPVIVSSGGLYSNAHDLRTLGLSIFHNTLLTANLTRTWLKPRSHTSSLTTSIGAPWEIYRLTLPATPGSNRTRISDLYSKLGGNVAYGTFFGLSPDHSIGYSVFVAGSAALKDRLPLRSLVGAAFVPAAEAAAFENAKENYAGAFVDPNNPLSNLTLTVDADKVGLGLAALYINGSNALTSIAGPGTDPSKADKLSVRLFATGGDYAAPEGGATVKPFQAVVGLAGGRDVPKRSIITGGKALFDDGCAAWENTGFYAESGFEIEIVGGKAQAVRWLEKGVELVRAE